MYAKQLHRKKLRRHDHGLCVMLRVPTVVSDLINVPLQ